jgi:peptidoglycan/xylan/chitin deacetylase (PgdA/CDA1 family)
MPLGTCARGGIGASCAMEVVPVRASLTRFRRAVVAAFVVVLVVQPAAAQGAARVVSHGSRSASLVALTFDDGWSLDRCRSIAGTLRARHAPATFFINGSHLAAAPRAWREVLDGFEVANHTYSHPWLTRIGDHRIRRQIARDEAVVEEILGRPMLKAIRPPYGAYDADVLRIAGRLGYSVLVTWDASAADTARNATVASVVRHATAGGNGSIVLLHCGPVPTPSALGAVIHDYRARGYRLVGLGELLGIGT